MIPGLWPGESILVEPSNLEDLQLGDVVVFLRERQLIAHRIVDLCGSGDALAVFTRGDARLHDDSPVWPAELIGVARVACGLRTERPLGGRRSIAAGVLSWAVRRSAGARFLLGGVHSRLVTLTNAVRRRRTAA